MLVFLLYPLLLRLRAARRKEEEFLKNEVSPSISLIVVARNAEDLLHALVFETADDQLRRFHLVPFGVIECLYSWIPERLPVSEAV